MKKAFSKLLIVILVCGGAFSLHADILDDLAKDIDSIEKKYWHAICNQHTEVDFFISTKNLLDSTQAKASIVQKSLINRKCESKYGNISKAVASLRIHYSDYGMHPVRFFKLDIPTTSMTDYTRDFQRTPNAKKGKVLQKPTLANVDIEHYDRWLVDIMDKQAEKKYSYRAIYQKKKPKSQERRDSQLGQAQQAVNEYMARICKIRLLLVDICQITNRAVKTQSR